MFGVHLAVPFEGWWGRGSIRLPESCVGAGRWGLHSLAYLRRNIWFHTDRRFPAFMCGQSGCRQAGWPATQAAEMTDSMGQAPRQTVLGKWKNDRVGWKLWWLRYCMTWEGVREKEKVGMEWGLPGRGEEKRTDRGRDTSHVCLMFKLPGVLQP